jgi:hypothetical protein
LLTPIVPRLSAVPGVVAPGDTIVVAWTDLDDPDPLDWIGLYRPGDDDRRYYSWTYLTCPTVGTRPKASAYCVLSIDPSMPPGHYEFRVFDDNGYRRTETSNVVEVRPMGPTP